MGLVAKVLPKNKRTMGVSVHSLVRRIPMALGPMAGGLFIGIWGVQQGIRYAFISAIGVALVSVIVQQRLIEDDKPQQPLADRDKRLGLKSLAAEMSPSLRRLLISDILIRFCEQIPYAFIVIYCVHSADIQTGTVQIEQPITALQFGYLRTIEMATAIMIYLPVAYLADRATKKPFVVATFCFFTLFPVAMLFAKSFWWLVPIFIIRGLKEFGEPSRKALIMDLAPEDKKAAMFGVYYLIRDIIVSIAAFGGAFLWQIGPSTNFLAAACFGAIGTVWFSLSRDEKE